MVVTVLYSSQRQLVLGVIEAAIADVVAADIESCLLTGPLYGVDLAGGTVAVTSFSLTSAVELSLIHI